MLALSVSVLLLSACSGGGDGGEPAAQEAALTGVFEDSRVQGLHYETATRSGETNAAGEYNYLAGETVTFSLGGIILGSTVAGPVVTPLNLVPNATGAADPVVINMVRFLLTLDTDGNPDNGISLSAATATAALSLSVDFTVADLSNDPGVVALISQLPGAPVLMDVNTAQVHFAQTLAARPQSDWGVMAWGSGSWKSKTP